MARSPPRAQAGHASKLAPVRLCFEVEKVKGPLDGRGLLQLCEVNEWHGGLLRCGENVRSQF
jgi:hypothetical protein